MDSYLHVEDYYFISQTYSASYCRFACSITATNTEDLAKAQCNSAGN
jgi:hypothetical protein